MTPDLAAVVMAGGLGTRMRSRTPKHLHPLLGRRMVDWVLAAARPLGADPLVVVCSPQTEDAMRASLDGSVALAVQASPRGTGDAVAAARGALDGFGGDVLVLSGDTPLLRAEVLEELVATHRDEEAAATILAIEPEQPKPYGRIVRDAIGGVLEIVEELDATPEQREIRECNSSIYVFRSDDLWRALGRLDPHNAQGELYLTDTIRHLVADGLRVAVHTAADPFDAEGVNTRVELAAAARVLRDRINEAHMLAGAAIADPQSTWIEPDVELEPDCTIHPFTVLRGTSRVGAGAEVGPHAVLVDAEVGARALVGPFCYLRPGTRLAAGAKAGTFVEIKNSDIGEDTKVPHLSYIGDAEIGAGTNVGAGSITANFPHQPGRPKGRTTIGSNVRIGIHDSLMAPVEIGDNSWIAAGSVITDDVPPDSLAGFPPRQTTKEGYLRGDDD
ncbi:MAG TPA: bifunctional UDP-N-acetylglucosamine diphosphorylase/glucosamine-1-phosphate N-acetyltransferase GlmU [Gaiellaceae bacterium]|nr:bifunctional UDP-N-acetylglucosamine diphosphorylase/glucosamine-1-phosphate N-acetyltransferase GlmU [Gaiellaceae bacterium]